MCNVIRKNEGNVLFLILIAVALFAALSYAVTQTSRSGDGGIDKDKARLAASEIAQYASSIEQAITRLKVLNRCKDTEINFENGVDAGYANTGAPADDRCDVFSPAGGGISFRADLPNPVRISGQSGHLWDYFGFIGKNDFPQVGQAGCGDDCIDLHVFLWTRDVALCKALNVAEGYPELNTLVTADFVRGTPKFTGTYTGATQTAPTEFYGKRGGCSIYSSDPTRMIYYHVLMSR